VKCDFPKGTALVVGRMGSRGLSLGIELFDPVKLRLKGITSAAGQMSV